MSDSYTMDDYIKENVVDKYNLKPTKYGYKMGILPYEYGSLLSRKDDNIWYVATDANVLFYDNKPCGIIYNGYTLFNSIALVTKVIDSVNDKLKSIKELNIEVKKKEIEKDFEDVSI
ncbi:MAG: hypothetical protein IKP65_03710 [Alphaproteobacteria bacterium]|nr:hypothetical protein [Alphaproteobacteria bacterium]